MSNTMVLLQSHEVPDHFKERYINTAYRRPGSSLAACMRSVLEPTNETLNFWTHLIPGLWFLWQMYVTFTEACSHNDPYMEPLIIFMLSAALCPLISALAHVFNAHSHKARHICFFFDYSALSFYSLGSAVAYKAYVFPVALMGTTFSRIYIYVAVFNSVTSLVMSCMSRFLRPGIWHKLMRTLAFGMPYLYVSLPLMYRLLFCEDWECQEAGLWYYKVQFVYAFLSCACYMSHLPESFWPNTFDVVGHSHQLFHVTASLGTMYQIYGMQSDILAWDAHPLRRTTIEQFSEVGLLVGTVMSINAMLLAVFIYTLYHTKTGHPEKPIANGTYKDHNRNGLDSDMMCDTATEKDSRVLNGPVNPAPVSIHRRHIQQAEESHKNGAVLGHCSREHSDWHNGIKDTLTLYVLNWFCHFMEPRWQ